MTLNCHYTTLGVERTATHEEIVAAYRRMAMKWHPDRHMDPAMKHEAEQHFKQVQQAYATLSDAARRANYDQIQSTPDPFGFNWGSESGSPWQRHQQEWAARAAEEAKRRREAAPRGADIQKKASVTLAEALNGTTIEVDHDVQSYCNVCDDHCEVWHECMTCEGTGRLRRRYCPNCGGRGGFHLRCSTCNGKGVVTQKKKLGLRLPAGMIDGAQLVAKERGKPSRHGGLAGDLVIKVSIKPERGWKFKGANIDGTLKINYSTAMFGGTVDVELPHGKTVPVAVPARTNSGKRIRLDGLGLYNRDTEACGDVTLIASIVLPATRKKISPAVEHLLRNLDAGLDV